MVLDYKNKRSEADILNSSVKAKIKIPKQNMSNNILIKGENLSVMNTLIHDYNYSGKVDLVYIDPPFSTNNVFRFNEERSASISSDPDDEIAYTDELTNENYLEFLRERLVFIRELMSDTASIYLHIDYKIGHYVKIIMDEIFGRSNFRNDITRIKCNPKNFKRKAYSNIKDLILFYTKTENFIWNEPYTKIDNIRINKLFNKIDTRGKRYTTNPLHAPGKTKNGKTGHDWRGVPPPDGRHWRYPPDVLEELDKNGLVEWSKNGVPRKIIYADDYGTMRVQDIWEFKDPQNQNYPTEKNIELLNLIIKTSSNEGQLVMDCFCGSGSTLLSAAQLGRKWIGIDESQHAIFATKKRLDSTKSLFLDYTYIETK